MDRPRKDPTALLERLGALWRLERRTAHARFVAERREVSLAERVERGIALRELSIDETGAAPGGKTLLWLVTQRPSDMTHLRVGPGNPVHLWWEDPDGDNAILATVARRQGLRIAVLVDGDLPDRFDEGGFRLDRDESQATFDRGDRALRRLQTARPGTAEATLREVLFGGQPLRFGPDPAWQPRDPELNEPQRAAVRRALAAEDLVLIHGPPGTGKTRTLVEIIRQAVHRGERVLATAASNAAVDNLAERLVAAGVSVVRLGHPARVSAAMEARSLDSLLEASEEYALARRWMAEANELRRRAHKRWMRRSIDRAERQAAQREASSLLRDARKQIQGMQEALLRRAPVICATAAGADAALLGDLTFDRVVLDEATQVPDPIALVALLRCGKAVMAGDPHQLPPTILDREAERGGLGTTLFERLAGPYEGGADPDSPVRMLLVQHRMNETLMAFPSRSKYGGRLIAAPQVAAQRLEDLGVQPDPLRPGPLIFVDTAGKGWEERRGTEDPSTSNPQQAARVAAEVRRLLGRGLRPTDLALITPYDAQVRLLRAALPAEVEAGLEVGTVDGFQGREKQAVIVDLVRSNEAGQIGFLSDTRRMNVALTRAQRLLIVVGDSATLGRHPYYEAFLHTVERSGAWVSAWTDEAPPFGD